MQRSFGLSSHICLRHDWLVLHIVVRLLGNHVCTTSNLLKSLTSYSRQSFAQALISCLRLLSVKFQLLVFCSSYFFFKELYIPS